MTKPVAGGTSQPGDQDRRAAAAKEASGAYVAYDQFIDDQLHTARRQVRTVDIAYSLMVLGAGTLGYFLVAVLFDHWLLPGGLGIVGRWLALLIYLGGAVAYSWRSLLPLCLHRINPVYAAHAIERSKPTLKNSLINFLLLRAKPADLAPQVYEAIEQHAATELAQVPVEAAIDRSKLIHIGYAFLGLVLVAAIYKVSSPKDPFQTFGRIALPWADIAPPTRVTIVDVKPGNSTVMSGQRAKISAEIRGISRQQAVSLVYSSDDGQIVDRAVVMQVPPDGYLFECELPDGKGGIQQDVFYRVVAGDATSNAFRLTVQPAPTIVVESVEYIYPSYTGMVAQTIDHQGDLKGIEGTRVILHALSNQPIKAATIDFDCNGTDDQRMTFDDRHATATVTLALKPDRQTPEHSSYQLRFTNTDGNENPQPIRHQIEVTRDVAPEIQFLAPKRDEIDVPQNGRLVCEISAHDPDFALARVALIGQTAAGQPFERSLLEEASKTDQPWQGQFHTKLVLVPQKLGLKAGDVLEYWAWAEDNKTPLANRTETIHRRARIVSPTKSEVSPDALASRDQQPDADPRGNSGKGDKEPENKLETPDADSDPEDHAEPPKADADPARPQNPPRDGARSQKSDPRIDKQPGKDDRRQDPQREQDRIQAEKEQAEKDQGEQGQPERDRAAQEQGGQEEAGQQSEKGQPGKGKPGKGKPGENAAGQEESGGGEAGDASPADDSQGADGGKPGARGKPGAKRPRDAKRQPVAQDGTQDGEAFEEIIERENEKGQAGAGKENGQNKNKGGGAPPAHGAPEKQGKEKGAADDPAGGDMAAGDDNAAGNDKAAGAEKAAADKAAGGKKAGNKDKKPGDKAPGEKEKADKQPEEGLGADAGGKPADDDGKKAAPPDAGKKDPVGAPDGKKPLKGEKKNGDKKDGEKQGDEKVAGEEKDAGDQGAGEKQDGAMQDGEKKAGDKNAGDDGKKGPPPANGKKDPPGPRNGKTPPNADKQDGDLQADNKQNGEKKAGDKQPADMQAGEPEAGDGKLPADKKSPAAKKQPDTKSRPDGKAMDPAAEGDEKNPAKANRQPAPGNAQPEPGKAGPGQPPQEKQPKRDGADDKQPDETGGGEMAPDEMQPANKEPTDQQDTGTQNADGQPPAEPTEKHRSAGHLPADPKTDTKPPEPETDLVDEQDDRSDHHSKQLEDLKNGQGGTPDDKESDKLMQDAAPNAKLKNKRPEEKKEDGEHGPGKAVPDSQAGPPKGKGNAPPAKQPPGQGDESGEKQGKSNPPSANGKKQQLPSGRETPDDQSGGRKEDGGKPSKVDTSDIPGSHDPGEGDGHAMDDSDGQEKSDDPNGKRPGGASDSRKGSNPGSSPSGNGSKPGGAGGKGSDKATADPGPGKEGSSDHANTETGLGGAGGGRNEAVEPPPAAPEKADAANLEFTRKATELTIQRLRDQIAKGEVDQELLDRLQWSQQDMERWVRRWEELFRRSEQQGKDGQDARKELDATLRSLGLRPHGTEISAHRRDDTTHGMKEGRRTQPPAEYRDQVRQYLQGISRSQNGATTGGATPRQAAPAKAGTEK